MTLLLAADMGGTKSNLWLFERKGGHREIRHEVTLRSADFPNARSVVAAFLKGARVDAAAVAIAGPVREGRAETPNLPWEVEQAAIVTDGDRQVALPSEGGHADFAPGNETEIALLQYLARRYGHVSWERVVSGPGLHAIYDFIIDTSRGEPSDELAARMVLSDPSAAIAQAALEGSNAAAAQALDIFVRLYGAEAGNLALKFLATGGVYVAGGIAPKILARLRSNRFMEGFLAKGRHSDLLAAIPVKVVLEPKAALLGAARRAEALAAA